MSKIQVRIRPPSPDAAAISVQSAADQTARVVALGRAEYFVQGEAGQPLAKVKMTRLAQDLVLQDAQGQEQVVLAGYYTVCAESACSWQGLLPESAAPQQGWVSSSGAQPEALAAGQSAVFEWGALPVASAVTATNAEDQFLGLGWPALGGLSALGLGAAFGGGHDTPNTSAGGSLRIQGTISAGPLLSAGHVRVEVYRNGVKLPGEATVDADGAYSLTVQNAQSGVYVLRVRDDNGADANYRSETGSQEDLVVELRAAIAIDARAEQATVNITPLTELATRKMVDANNPNLVSSGVSVVSINRSMAALWGLGEVDVTQETPQLTITPEGQPTAQSNAYGQVLALLAGLDEVKGHMAAALDSLSAQLLVTQGVVTWNPASATVALSDLTAATVRLAASALSANDLSIRLPADLVRSDATAPSVQDDRVGTMGLTSAGQLQAGALVAGDVLQVSVGVSEVVLVDGSPTLNLRIGAHNRSAVWDGVNGTRQLVFQYTITDQDVSGSAGVIITGWPAGQALPKDGAGHALVQTDSLVNKSLPAVVVDGVAPQAPTLALNADTGPDGRLNNDGLTNDGTLRIGGLETQSGARWEYSLDDAQSWQAGALNSAGHAPNLFGPSSGAYSVRVRQIDAAGNVSLASEALRFELDTVAPPPPTIDVVAGDNAITLADAANPILVTGTAPAGASLTLTWGGVSRNAVASATDGVWRSEFLFSEIPTTSVGRMEATVADAAGNTSTASRNVSVSRNPLIDPITENGDDLIGVFEKLNGVTLGGWANPGARLQVAWPNLNLPNAVFADAAGRWEVFADTRDLNDGAYTIRVTEGVRTSSRVVNVDTLHDPWPTISAVAEDNIVNGREITAGVQITGTAEPGSGVRVEWGGLTRDLGVSATGQWTAVFDPGQSPGEGTQTVRVSATDRVGNAASVSRPVWVDTLPPPLPLMDEVGTQNVVNAALQSAGVLITGTASVASEVTLVWGGVTKRCTADPTGRWSTTVTASELPADAAVTTVSASVTDAVGNSATTERVVRIDTVVSLPGLDVVASDDQINANEATAGITLAGMAEVGASVAVLWREASPGGSVLLSRTVTAHAGTGAWTLAVSADDLPHPAALTGADTLITAVQTDSAGNVSGASTRRVGVDRNMPAAAVLDTVADDYAINALEKAAGVLLSGTAEPHTAVEVTWAGVGQSTRSNQLGVWQVPFSSTEVPADGTRPVQVVVRDGVGNASAATWASVVIDTQSPAAPALSVVADNHVVNQSEYANPIVLSGTGEAGAFVAIDWAGQIKDETAPFTPIQVGINGLWSVTYATDELPVQAGNSTIAVTLRDAAGNVGPVLIQNVRMAIDDAVLSIDDVSTSDGDLATPDDNMINASETQSPVILSGMADPGAVVTVNWGAGVVNQHVNANTVGVWSLRVAPDDLPTTDTSVNVRAINPDGNTQSATLVVTLDTTAPAAPLIDAVTGDNFIDASEAQEGVTISGVAVGATAVELTWGDLFHTVPVDELTHQWIHTFEPGAVPPTSTTIVGVTANDLAGNASWASSLIVRLDAPVMAA